MSVSYMRVSPTRGQYVIGCGAGSSRLPHAFTLSDSLTPSLSHVKQAEGETARGMYDSNNLTLNMLVVRS